MSKLIKYGNLYSIYTASCYVLKLLYVVWVTILSTLAVILGYVICLLGLLAGQPDTSRDIARSLGIWWRD